MIKTNVNRISFSMRKAKTKDMLMDFITKLILHNGKKTKTKRYSGTRVFPFCISQTGNKITALPGNPAY